ncbi:MAG: bifunctional diguanylate cyclase/phosphodiesterase, partial [Campylobacterales bacterium]|nr:bifunctional diguanylate cyclase/phosphodiesterase [Campylobacterales bacterium]
DFELAGKSVRVSAVMDISTVKEKEKKILELACYDPLTSLPNRTLLMDRLENLIQKTKRSQTIGALLFIDLDDFKTINDTKGHFVGDGVIKESAKRIIGSIRQSDTACRLGGDEFVVLIDTSEADIAVATKSISKIATKILSTLKDAYIIGDYEFRLTASMGISVFCGDEYSVEDLMKHADSAMYHAKANGRNAFNFFDPNLQRAIEEKAYMVEKLRNALKNDELELHYQTQVDDSGFIVGVEALARWIDKDLGFVSPAVFIPLAEENGLIVQLGEWVIKEAVKLLKSWEQDEIKRNWRVSINISSKQFERRDFTNILYATILEHKAQPDNLRLEITESLLFKNTGEALAKINHLKELGITLSIDDFGTGYSSLSYLKQLPIDELKIDRSFINDLTKDQNDVIIVQTIISIGRKFGLEVIAEGVETKEQLEMLLAMGCKNFQGYFFSKPVRASEL